MERPSRQRDGNPKSGSGAGPVSADHGENGLGGRRVQLRGTNFLFLFCLFGVVQGIAVVIDGGDGRWMKYAETET